MDSATLIDRLRDPACYPHPVDTVRVIETHISWVLLAGGYAYKIKKPVNFGFLDFSTPQARRFFCHEELRLNRRLAPGLYLDVVGLHGTPDVPRIGGEPGAFEYAVKMRAFDPAMQLDAMLDRGELSAAHIDELAATVAAFHRDAERADANSDHGRPETILAPVAQNFAQIGALLDVESERAALSEVETWSLAEHARLTPIFEVRRAGGFVRECHGDLHLANIAQVEGRITPFDALEFNPELRWIDAMSEIAFLRMDLDLRGRADFSWRALDRYLEHGGDFDGLAVLRFHEVYRAMVRAKVARMRAAQLTDAEREAALADYARHLDWARQRTRPARPALVITHGLSGSGKSTVALALVEALGMVRVRSDVERRRLDLAPEARYTPAATEATYARLAQVAATMLDAGYTAIVDAAFLKRIERERMREIARCRGVPFLILVCEADAAELRRRVAARAVTGIDPSEATLDVLAMQTQWVEPVAEQEADSVPQVDSNAMDIAALAGRLREWYEPTC
jgi:aminoglycoside phosphotransferase family enzyme/gluconate kinase